jgi:hypothetical protein
MYAELILLGWLVLFITGIWYRLFGFLLWLHFPREGDGAPVPPAAELGHRPTQWAALGFLAAGVIGVVTGTGVASIAATRAGAVGILAGSVLVAGHYLRIYARGSRGHRPRR